MEKTMIEKHIIPDRPLARGDKPGTPLWEPKTSSQAQMRAQADAVRSIKEMVAEIMNRRQPATNAIATTKVMHETVCPVCFNARWVSEDDETPWPVDPRSGVKSLAAGMPCPVCNKAMDQKPGYHPEGSATE
jgi:hypothetical protein